MDSRKRNLTANEVLELIGIARDLLEKIPCSRLEVGRLDILVNNAGVYNLLPLAEVTEEDFHRHFNINVLGLLLATQEAASIWRNSSSRREIPMTFRLCRVKFRP